MTAEEQALFGIDKLNVPRSDIPAVTHVDYSARIQTVHAETNPRYHALISRFKAKTGCPVLVNTSFNVRGEPIVCTPEDAFRCFMGTEIDVLSPVSVAKIAGRKRVNFICDGDGTACCFRRSPSNTPTATADASTPIGVRGHRPKRFAGI